MKRQDFQRAIKRAFDLLASLLGLILLFPLMALIALAIKLDPTLLPTSIVRSSRKARGGVDRTV